MKKLFNHIIVKKALYIWHEFLSECYETITNVLNCKKRLIRNTVIVTVCAIIVCSASVISVNASVKSTVEEKIITSKKAIELTDVDCILVLGCQVKDTGEPSGMLADRLTRGIELYKLGAAPKLLMTGDHGRIDYNEVGAMKQYAIEAGVPSEDIFMDHAGFSTYESMYRAKEIFEAKKIIIVTQEYHLYRAVYIAEQLGIEVYGVSSDYHSYAGQSMRDMREVLARCKDFASTILKPEPTYLGDVISIKDSGDLTNDY